jgi:hypothetical protein
VKISSIKQHLYLFHNDIALNFMKKKEVMINRQIPAVSGGSQKSEFLGSFQKRYFFSVPNKKMSDFSKSDFCESPRT